MKKAHIQVPEGFACRREGTGLFVHCGEMNFGIAPMAGGMWRSVVGNFGRLPEALVEPFQAGEFSGYRVSRDGLVRSYLLRGQGKFLMLNVACDPALVEQLLPTLRFAEED